MKIALCDDEPVFSVRLKSAVYAYANKNNWEPAVDVYKSGTELVKANVRYDIIILDYKMDGLNGLETAKALRAGVNCFSCIIFLTNYPEIAIPAYEVDTYRFVLKNTLNQGLFNALDDFRRMKGFDYDISVKACPDNFLLTLNTSEIIFIEVINKECIIHTTNGGEILTRRSLSGLFSELPNTHFYRIHKAYAVNFQHIKERSNTFLKVTGCSLQLPISRNYLREFKKAYYNFLKNQ